MPEMARQAVLVVGSGVAGLKAALEVASRGTQVYLIDRSPFLGGEIMRLERQFPTDHCGLCRMLPTTNRTYEGEYCLRRDFYHPLIELITQAEVIKLSGNKGNFKATLRIGARGVDQELCTGCGRCIEVCPEEINQGICPPVGRKAIFFQDLQPVPPIPAINWSACTRCGKCMEVCPTGAINLHMADRERVLELESVILAPGFDEFDPHLLTQYGYGRWQNVITGLEWEQIIGPLRPFGQGIRRPSDNKTVQRIAFILCAGSRTRRRDFCSAACCMYAVKEAIWAKELGNELEVSIFYMDLRTYGKGHQRYIEQARAKGVRFVRGRIPRVQEDPRSKDLLLTTMRDDQVTRERFDFCILALGHSPPQGNLELAKVFGIELNQWGFCKTTDPAGIETTRPGVYVCGSFSEPKDISDAVTQATACALVALDEPPSWEEKPDNEIAPTGSDEEQRVGLVLCRCRTKISDSLDLTRLKQELAKYRSIAAFSEIDALCTKGRAKELFEEMHKAGVNRLVVGACAPYWFRRRFLSAAKLIDPWFVEWVNLSKDVPPDAAAMLGMALERLRRKEWRVSRVALRRNRVLIVGEGLAGLAAAAALADKGVAVHLVEFGAQPGSRFDTVTGEPDLLGKYLRRVENNSLVHSHCMSEVVGFSGQGGNFRVVIKGLDGEHEIKVGAVIVATGAEEYRPQEFLYGEDSRVVTQRQLSQKIISGEIDWRQMRTIVMIQCVGSRNAKHSWCSRYCCTLALENALALREKNSEMRLVVFFTDMMSYGFREALYSKARDAGMTFIREATIEDINVKAGERLKVISPQIEIDCDLLVLSTGIVPNSENPRLAAVFGLDLDVDGFFKEAEVKFRPVDAVREGIYLCGGAHSPRSSQEVILQAQAAAQRTLAFLHRQRVLSPGIISRVNDRRCSGCALCVSACLYGARSFDEDRLVAVVDAALCQGCGTCSTVCPNGAAWLDGFTEGQVMAMVEHGI